MTSYMTAWCSQSVQGLDLTWPVCDQTVTALRLHLDVGATACLQRQDVRSVRGLADLLPEAPALQRPCDQPAAGEGAGRCPRDIAQRRHWTPGNIRDHQVIAFRKNKRQFAAF